MRRKIASLLFVVFLSVSSSGCAVLAGAVVGGVGTAVWITGKVSEEVDADYDRTVRAAKRAVDSLDMDIEKETTTDQITQLISRYSDGSKVWIDIKRLTSSSTKIEIRVGVRGNKAASTKILEAIKKYL
jgi:hypothetical protein